MANKPKRLQDLCDEYTGYLLSQFVTEGGKGLRSALFDAMVSAIQWRDEQKKHEAEKEKKA
jgi:hypothetical protein